MKGKEDTLECYQHSTCGGDSDTEHYSYSLLRKRAQQELEKMQEQLNIQPFVYNPEYYGELCKGGAND